MQRRGYVEVHRHNGGHNWLKHVENGVKLGISYHSLTEPIHEHVVSMELYALGFSVEEVQEILAKLR